MADTFTIPEGWTEVSHEDAFAAPEGWTETTPRALPFKMPENAKPLSPEDAAKLEDTVRGAQVPRSDAWWAAERQRAALADADPMSKAPSVIREPYYAVAGAGAGILGTAVRPFSKDAADYVAKVEQQINTESEAARKDDWSPWFSRMYGGAARSLVQAGVAAPLGTAGIIASFALTEGNQALYDAEQAGLTGNDRLAYAAVQGAIEGGVAGVFQMFAPGLEGFISGMAKSVMKTSGKQFLAMTLQELPEELITEVGHAAAEQAYGINPQAVDTTSPQFWQRMGETISQTLLTLGIAQATARLGALNSIRDAKPQEVKQRAAAAGINGSRKEIRQKVEAEAKRIEKAIGENVPPSSATEGDTFTDSIGLEYTFQNGSWTPTGFPDRSTEKEVQHAGTVPGTGEKVWEGKGGADLRGQGQKQVSAQPAGEGAAAPEVQVAPEAAPEAPTTFTTSAGSTYEFAEGRTTRTKSLHQFHDPKDIGKKERSDLTVFVDPEFAREIGMWQGLQDVQGMRIVLTKDGNVLLTNIDPKTGERKRSKSVGSFTTTPEVGKSPLELWGQDEPGFWKGNHPGNVITSIGESASAAPEVQVAPEAPPETMAEAIRKEIASRKPPEAPARERSQTERPVTQDVQEPVPQRNPLIDVEARVEEIFKSRHNGRTGDKRIDGRREEAIRKEVSEEEQALQKYPPGSVLRIKGKGSVSGWEYTVQPDGRLKDPLGRTGSKEELRRQVLQSPEGITVISKPEAAPAPPAPQAEETERLAVLAKEAEAYDEAAKRAREQAEAVPQAPVNENRVAELMRRKGFSAPTGNQDFDERRNRVETTIRREVAEEEERLRQYPPGTRLKIPSFNQKQEFLVGDDGKLREVFGEQTGRAMGDNAGAVLRHYKPEQITVVPQPEAKGDIVTPPTEAVSPSPRERAQQKQLERPQEPIQPPQPDEQSGAKKAAEIRRQKKQQGRTQKAAPEAPTQPQAASEAKTTTEATQPLPTQQEATGKPQEAVPKKSVRKSKPVSAEQVPVETATEAVRKYTPEAATEAWIQSQPNPEYFRGRAGKKGSVVTYVRRLAKRLKGWQTAEALTVADRKGRLDVGRTADTLKEMRATGHVQIAWDKTGMPHYAWGKESLPDWLTQSENDADMAALPEAPKKEAKQKGVRKPKPKGDPQTLIQAIQQLGGLSAQKLKAEGINIYEDLKQFGLLGVFKGSKKGSVGLQDLEEMARELESGGYWKAPEGANKGDALLQALKEQAKTIQGIESEDFEASYKKHVEQLEQESRDGKEQGEEADSQREDLLAGAQDGLDEAGATEGEAAEVLGEIDDSFNFGVFAPPAGIPGAQQALFENKTKQTLFNVNEGPKVKAPVSSGPSELERVAAEKEEGRVESIPGQKNLAGMDDMAAAIAEEFQGRKKKTRAQQAADKKAAALKKLKDASRRLIDPTKPSSGLDPSKVKAAVDMTIAAVEYGVRSFEEFVYLAIDTMGRKRVLEHAPYLEEAARQSDIPNVTSVAEVLEAIPEQAPQPSGETTGTKNVKTDELRAELGMEERPDVDSQSVEEWQEKAAARMAEDPQYALNLAEEVSATPRALTPIEETVLGRHIRDLKNRLNAGEDVYNELRTAIEADEKVGETWGRTGVARQAELAADFTVVGFIKRHMRDVNQAPTDEQIARYAELEKEIEKSEGELKELQQKKAQAEVDLQIAEAKSTKAEARKAPAEKRGTKRERLKREAAAAVDAFKNEWASLNQMGIVNDPKQNADKWIALTKAAGRIVKVYAEMGVDSFLELLSVVQKEFGAFTSAQKESFREAWDEYKASSKALTADIPDPAAIGLLARKLTRWAVESGITEREEVIDAVHGELTDMGFDLTRSDTMAAMSGYGDFRELSKDEVSVIIRRHRGEIQQILKLEDMQHGQAPKKTGVERRTPSDEERRLIKLVNEGKKRGGYVVTDPGRQLKSALGAAKTAVTNRIADLKNAIAKREKIVSGQTTLTPDAELTALRKERDTLQEEYLKIFPPKKSSMSDAARLKAAEALLDRMIAETQADLDTRNFEPKEKRAPLTSPELEAKRKKLNDLRNSLKAAKAAAAEAATAEWESEGGAPAAPKGKRPLTDAQRLKAREAAIERQIEQLQEDLRKGQLGPQEKREPLSSPALEAKQLLLSQLKAVREKARLASPEYQAQLEAKQTARYKKSLERQLAMWEARRDEAVRGIPPKKRKPTPLDNEILEKKYQIEQVKRQALAEIEESARAARSKTGKAIGFGGDLLDLSQAIMTGYEMSAVLRQGAFYTLGFPRQASKAWVASVRAFFSRRADFSAHDNLMQRQNHLEYMRGKLETTAADGPLSHREELIRSRIASWLVAQKGMAWAVPRWLAEGLLGSERSFRTFTNTMRADLFDYMKNSVDASRPGTWSEDDAKIVGNASNVFSGRGKLPGNMTGVSSSRVFFAPRWVWSRVQLLGFQPMWRGDRAMRFAVGKVYVRAAFGFAGYQVLKHVIYSLLADDDDEKPQYELDMRSSDFGKMRVGDTRIDAGAGLNQVLTLAARIKTGETKRADGKIVAIRGEDVPDGASDTRDVVHRFIDSKLAPLPSAVLDWISGENIVGDKATVGKIVGDRMSPMTWRDIFDAEKALGVKQGTVAAIEAFFGEGVTTYGQKTQFREADEAGRQAIIERDLKNLTWDAPVRPPYAQFLSDEQLKQFEDRQVNRRGLVIVNATYDGKNEEELAMRDKNREYVQEMKEEGVTYKEAYQILRSYYRNNKSKGISEGEAESISKRARILRRLYQE